VGVTQNQHREETKLTTIPAGRVPHNCRSRAIRLHRPKTHTSKNGLCGAPGGDDLQPDWHGQA